MSGIAGIFYLDGRPVAAETADALCQSIAHRGPDALRIHRTGSVALVHTMLHTTPTSLGENLPYEDQQTGLLITADARLDNHDELIRRLARNRDPATIPDSQLILAAYRKWGDDCAKHLIGDFAFAIWDAPAHTLFCARDHMGTKPFYYYHDDRCFLFGSEIKAIFSAAQFTPRINDQRIYDYLVFYHSDNESTFYHNIKRLPARHCLKFSPQVFKLWQYWDFNPDIEIRLSSDQDYAEAFREQFERAVACRLNSAYPIGAFLSGGLDSSSIVCVAQRQLAQQNRPPLTTFSEIFTNLPETVRHRSDERKYMDAVIRHCRPTARFVPITDENPIKNLDLPIYDEPMPYFNGYLLDQTCRAAQTDGVRILLDGSDGDTTVSHGFERLYHLGTTFRLLALLRESRAFYRRQNQPFSARKILKIYCVRPYLSDATVDTIKRQLGRTVPSRMPILELLNPHFSQNCDWRERAKELEPHPSYRRQGRRLHYQAFLSPLEQYTMEFIDARMASSRLEIRYPFWDRRLMEFCLALPLEQKINNGWTRFVLRNAMHGILPPEVEQRADKADLSPYFLLSFARYAQPEIDRILRPGAPISPYVNQQTVAKWWQRFCANPLRGEKLAMALYGVISLAAWFKNNNTQKSNIPV